MPVKIEVWRGRKAQAESVCFLKVGKRGTHILNSWISGLYFVGFFVARPLLDITTGSKPLVRVGGFCGKRTRGSVPREDQCKRIWRDASGVSGVGESRAHHPGGL